MTRVVSGAILAAAALAAILFLPLIGLRMVACIVAVLAAHEYAMLVGPSRWTEGIAFFGAGLACWSLAAGMPGELLGLAIGLSLLIVVAVLGPKLSIQSACASAFAMVYIGVPLGMLAAIHRVHGPALTLVTIATVAVSDTAQYYTGRAFGRHHLAPAISPKKTIEGAIGGVVIGTAFVAAAGAYLYQVPLRRAIPFGIVVVVLGIAGDLFESQIKRHAGVKDSSSLIPGHGGVLDRIDALLFVTPAFYAYFVK
jgi:phosphatidate cytidylyltransferase